MTYRIAPEGPRRVAARRLSERMRLVMARDGVSTRSLAARLDTTRSLVMLWRKGECLPSLDSAARLADALGDDRILAIVRDSRLVTCACGRQFESRGGGRKIYCSMTCRKAEQKVRDALLPKRDTIMRRLQLHADAVERFCRGCEPEGLCRTANCALRPVSPLALVERIGA